MVFSSLEFIFAFLPVFLVIYRILPKQFRNLWLVLGSFGFYSYGSLETPEYILYLFVSIVMNYSLGQLLADQEKYRKPLICAGVFFNVIPLVFFKLILEKIAFPIGISFFTFQNLSYIFDVYRGKSQPERSFIDYAAYISMFPQLISGPIVNYNSVKWQIHHRNYSGTEVLEGLKLFVLGLGAKVMIANRLGGLWNGVGSIGYESISTPLAWIGILAYSLQIYFDFLGYSVMAAGAGKMLGFQLPQNFYHPYAATSFRGFYRRWHMTLGVWFREYVYIPLGGNRKGTFTTVRNLFAVWILTSLWHGLTPNFILWGMSIFCLILLEKFVYGKYLQKYPLIGHCYLLALTPLMWLVFAISDWNDLCTYVTRLFPMLPQPERFIFVGDYLKYLKDYHVFLAAGIVFSFPWCERIWRRLEIWWVKVILLSVIFGVSVYYIYMGMNDPFLYFKF